MSEFGLKVAKQGERVDSGDDTNLVFSSLFSTLPVFKAISIDYSLSSFGFANKTVKHGLMFVPYCLVYYKSSYLYSDRWQWYPIGLSSLSPNGNTVGSLQVDNENVKFSISSLSSSTSTISLLIIIFNFPIALSL